MAVVHITNETFEKEVMQAEGKVLVDFFFDRLFDRGVYFEEETYTIRY